MAMPLNCPQIVWLAGGSKLGQLVIWFRGNCSDSDRIERFN